MKTFAPIAALALAGSAFAQSSVTIYGVVDAYVQAIDSHARIGRVQSGGLNGSRLGFRGEEDLGGGLRAYFVLESGFGIDDGVIGQGGAFYGRQAFVGLRGAWGELSAGRQYSSIYSATSDLSVFTDNGAGPSTSLIGGFGNGYEPVRGSALGATGNGGPVRVNNSLRYRTPEWQGLSASVLVGAGEVAGSADDTRLADVALRYSGHGIELLLSHVDDRVGTGTVHGQTTTLGGALRMADWRVVAGLLDFKDKTVAGRDGRGWWLGSDYRIGSHLLKVQYVQNEPRFGNDNSSRALGVGWVYSLSRRSALYGSLTRFDNESNAGNAGLGRLASAVPSGLTRAGDADATEFVLGIRHSF